MEQVDVDLRTGTVLIPFARSTPMDVTEIARRVAKSGLTVEQFRVEAVGTLTEALDAVLFQVAETGQVFPVEKNRKAEDILRQVTGKIRIRAEVRNWQETKGKKGKERKVSDPVLFILDSQQVGPTGTK